MAGRISGNFFLPVVLGAVLLLSPMMQSARGTTLELEGYAGTLSALDVSASSAGTPITLDIPNTLPVPATGTRTATANGSIEPGTVRLFAETIVGIGTPSLGGLTATIDGRWHDTLTFAPTSVGGLDIVAGTPLTFDLIMNIDGQLERTDSLDTGSSDPQTSFSAQLIADDCVTGSCFSSLGGSLVAGVSGTSEIDGDLAPLPSVGPADFAAVAPTQLIVAGVTAEVGAPFDLLFTLGITTRVEQSGATADSDFISRALFGSTASWGGVANVVADLGFAGVAIDQPDIVLTNALGKDFSSAFEAPAPIPLPPAVWLFGTALIGLVGISRRRSKAA